MEIKLDFNSVKKMFFDRAAVRRNVDVRTRKVLSKFGAHVRQTSKRSIRKRKGTSQPGNPPFSHTGTLKRFIFFGYDQSRRSVVIGPVIVPGKKGVAPSVLEYGGRINHPDGFRADIKARPYMGPAFKREIENLPNIWLTIIK